MKWKLWLTVMTAAGGQVAAESDDISRADMQLTKTKTVAAAPIPDIDRYSEKELLRIR